MANTINWGQGSANNENGWGKGGENSANDWGQVYANSPAGDTNIGVSEEVPFSLTLEEDLDLSTVTGGSQVYRGLYVSPDGTKVIANSYSGLEQFNRLDLSNANNLNGGLSFSDDGKWNAQPISVTASPDGVYGFNMRLGVDLYRRNLGTDLNFKTATNQVIFTPLLPFSTAALYQRQIAFKPDGLEFYVGVLDPTPAIATYTMETAWNISTLTLLSTDAYPTGVSLIYGFQFLSSGTKLLTVDDLGNAILRFCISYISPICPVLLITTTSCSLLYP